MIRDPKVLRSRKLGRDWTVKVAPDKAARKCSACMCKIWPGEATVVVHRHWMHRQCLKEWLEATYVQLPPQADEQERHLAGPLTTVDTERLQREWQEYRQSLVDRLQVSPECHELRLDSDKFAGHQAEEASR